MLIEQQCRLSSLSTSPWRLNLSTRCIIGIFFNYFLVPSRHFVCFNNSQPQHEVRKVTIRYSFHLIRINFFLSLETWSEAPRSFEKSFSFFRLTMRGTRLAPGLFLNSKILLLEAFSQKQREENIVSKYLCPLLCRMPSQGFMIHLIWLFRGLCRRT